MAARILSTALCALPRQRIAITAGKELDAFHPWPHLDILVANQTR
jgi:hypothetical protein